MDRFREVQETDYFRLRKMPPRAGDNYRLPISIRRVLPSDRNAPILDIGCGFGHVLTALRALGFTNAKGIDISREAVSSCRESGLDVTLVSSIPSYAAGAEQKFDFVLLSHVLEHIDKKDVIETLLSVRARLLSENGAILVIVPNAQADDGCYWTYEDFTHMTMFTSGSLYYVLMAAGFDHVEFINMDGYEDYPGWKSALKRLLLRFYIARKHFWRKVTLAQIHKPSPEIYTFELRALARPANAGQAPAQRA